MRHLISILMVLGILLAACTRETEPSHSDVIPGEALRHLDKTISRAGEYAAAVRRPIDSLARKVQTTGDDAAAADMLASIAHSMSVLNSDSALKYADESVRRANLTDNDSVRVTAMISRLSALTSAGIFNLAEQELFALDKMPMSPKQRLDFWQVARQLYAYAEMYADSSFELSEQFRRKSVAYDDSLMSLLPENHQFRRFLMAERDMNQGNYRSAKALLDSLLPHLRSGEHLYGMVTYQLSLYYRNRGEEKLYGDYLAKAAESDIKSGVREGLALFNLANWLYSKGEINDAFRYVNFAMREAMAGQARMRAVNIATMLPMIDETYQNVARESHNRISVFLIISMIALVISVCLLVMLYTERRRGRKIQKRIAELSKARETQLANFLALCSTYYHKLHSLEMLVRRKIASGQTDELIKLLKSGRYSEDESEEIFTIFDRSFVEIYPDFIEQINRLLRPEERFQTSFENGLPAELRIYALVTMGISESPRIAQILNYSVNTVYAYRNKMRNKALDRETFEEKVAAFEPFEHDFLS